MPSIYNSFNTFLNLPVRMSTIFQQGSQDYWEGHILNRIEAVDLKYAPKEKKAV